MQFTYKIRGGQAMKYSSNMEAVIKRLTGKLRQVANDQVMLTTIATTLQASNIERIHERGEAVSGANIGSYSRKPTYVNPSNSPKAISPKGKDGRNSFKNGKKKKTRYYSDGYKGFRSNIGRDTSNVNLSLSGKLSKEFGIQS